MGRLPNYPDDNRTFQMLQSTWSAILEPIIAIPFLSGRQIDNISISSGSAAVINHKLSRKLQGWWLVDQNAPASIARIAPLNDLTLTLSSNATVIVSVWVY